MREINERPNSSRYRKTLNGWSNKTLAGHELRMTSLSGSLTKTTGWRMTICDIDKKNTDYIINKINGIESEIIKTARENEARILKSIQKMTKEL